MPETLVQFNRPQSDGRSCCRPPPHGAGGRIYFSPIFRSAMVSQGPPGLQVCPVVRMPVTVILW